MEILSLPEVIEYEYNSAKNSADIFAALKKDRMYDKTNNIDSPFSDILKNKSDEDIATDCEAAANIFKDSKTGEPLQPISMVRFFDLMCRYDNSKKAAVMVLSDDGCVLNRSFYKNALMSFDFDLSQQLFLAVNPVNKKGRRIEQNLGGLTCFYVDLDVDKAGLTPEQAYVKINNDLILKNTAPCPNIVTFSGTGLHLYWLINDMGRSLNKVEEWRHITNNIIKSFSAFGSDTKCRDVLRLLRIPGSYNFKHNKKRMVYSFEICDKIYTQDTISKYFVCPEEEIGPEQIQTEAKKSKRSKKKTDDELDFMDDSLEKVHLSKSTVIRNTSHSDKKYRTEATALLHSSALALILNKEYKPTFGLPEYKTRQNNVVYKYLHDIATCLILLQDNVAGYREFGLFVFFTYMRKMNVPDEEAVNQTLKLNRHLYYPLSDKEVKEACCYITKNANYVFSYRRLIQEFHLDGINKSFNQYLIGFMIQEEVNVRNFKNKCFCKSDRDNIFRVYSVRLYREGYTQEEIANKIAIRFNTKKLSRQTIAKYLNFKSKASSILRIMRAFVCYVTNLILMVVKNIKVGYDRVHNLFKLSFGNQYIFLSNNVKNRNTINLVPLWELLLAPS